MKLKAFICFLLFIFSLSLKVYSMDKHALKLLKRDVKKFNKEYAGKKVDLSGSDFSRKTINEADLRYANIQNCIFKRAKFLGCKFNGADLSGSDFELAIFDNCIMNSVKIKKTFIYKLSSAHNKMETCEFTNSEFVDSEFYKCELSYSNLEKTKFKNCFF